MTKTLAKRLVDIRELLRFIFSGLTAATANISVTWMVRPYLSFGTSLLVGLSAGFSASFILSKWFAFRSFSRRRAPAELRRFTAVYAFGASIYWIVAFSMRRVLNSFEIPTKLADLGSIVGGGTVMMLSSYLGHRFFTYRSANTGAFRRKVPDPVAQSTTDLG